MAMTSQDLLSQAVAEVLTRAYFYDEQYPADKLQAKVTSYFHKAGKSLDMRQPWQKLLTEYTDNAMGSLFQAFGEKPWFKDVDFLAVLDAGFRNAMPYRVLNSVDNNQLNSAVVTEYDKSYKRKIAWYIMYDKCAEVTASEDDAKKVCKILKTAWDNAKLRMPEYLEGDMLLYVEEFVRDWATGTISKLTLKVLNEDACAHLFAALMENMVLPTEFTLGLEEMPGEWKDRASAVVIEVCSLASVGELPEYQPVEPPKKKKKAAVNDWDEDPHQFPSQQGPPHKFDDPRGYAKYMQNIGMGKGMGKGIGKGIGKYGGKGLKGWRKPRGHPRCIQGPDCVGDPQDYVYRHSNDSVVKGDIYCASCWDIFAEDETLEANYLRRHE